MGPLGPTTCPTRPRNGFPPPRAAPAPDEGDSDGGMSDGHSWDPVQITGVFDAFPDVTTDDEEQMTYFRLKDFEAFLKKNKFFELKSHKIAQRLRDINGESMLLKIKGRPVRVWKIPAYDSGDVELATPIFAAKGEAPF